VLSEIRIRGLGVIEDVTLELGPGLTVVTGETGAGKTMVVTGLYLLFGGRADPARVRSGSGRAVVDGRLRLPADSPVLARAADAGAEVDEDGELLVSRAIAVEGRSRAYLGGSAVPAGLLGELAEGVLAVHGQSDQLRLLKPAEQRAALDRYGSLGELVDRHREAFATWRRLADDLADRTARARELAREADGLRAGLEEIAAVEPQPGEDGALATEAEKLAHADALRLAARTAHVALAGDPDDPAADGADVTALLGGARRALAHESAADPELAALEKRLDEVSYLVADVGTELASDYGCSAPTAAVAVPPRTPTGFCSASVQPLLNELVSADPRADAAAAVERALWTQVPALPLFQPVTLVVSTPASDGLTGVGPGPLATGPVTGAERWRPPPG